MNSWEVQLSKVVTSDLKTNIAPQKTPFSFLRTVLTNFATLLPLAREIECFTLALSYLCKSRSLANSRSTEFQQLNPLPTSISNGYNLQQIQELTTKDMETNQAAKTYTSNKYQCLKRGSYSAAKMRIGLKILSIDLMQS